MWNEPGKRTALASFGVPSRDPIRKGECSGVCVGIQGRLLMLRALRISRLGGFDSNPGLFSGPSVTVKGFLLIEGCSPCERVILLYHFAE